MIMVSFREIANSLGVYGQDARFVEIVEECTVLAMQLGNGPLAAGTGGAYADFQVSADHAEIIIDMITHTDPETGVYTGDRDDVARLAAGH